MKVEHQRLQGTAQAYRSAWWERSGARGVGRARSAVREDQVDLSQAAQEVSALREMLRSEPAVRADRVAELRRQVEAGLYRIRTEELADRLLERTEVEL